MLKGIISREIYLFPVRIRAPSFRTRRQRAAISFSTVTKTLRSIPFQTPKISDAEAIDHPDYLTGTRLADDDSVMHSVSALELILVD